MHGKFIGRMLALVGVRRHKIATNRPAAKEQAPVVPPGHFSPEYERPHFDPEMTDEWQPPLQATVPSTASLGVVSDSSGLDTANDSDLSQVSSLENARASTVLDWQLPETEVIEPEAAALAWLVICEGKPVGEAFRLRQTTTIGRDPNCDIRVDDTAVSGKHVEVKIEDGRFFVYDCSSTNGVLVYTPESDHWEKVKSHEIKDGTRFKLGRTLFHLMALTVECC